MYVPHNILFGALTERDYGPHGTPYAASLNSRAEHLPSGERLARLVAYLFA